MNWERELVRWVSKEDRAEELHVGGAWARVYQGASIVRRDGSREAVVYWSAGVETGGLILSGSTSGENKAKKRAIRALLLCQRLASSARSLSTEGAST